MTSTALYSALPAKAGASPCAGTGQLKRLCVPALAPSAFSSLQSSRTSDPWPYCSGTAHCSLPVNNGANSDRLDYTMADSPKPAEVAGKVQYKSKKKKKKRKEIVLLMLPRLLSFLDTRSIRFSFSSIVSNVEWQNSGIS